MEYGPLKTPNSYRSLILPGIVLDVLKEHKEKQLREKERLGSPYQDEGLMFANEFGGKLDIRHLYRLHCKALIDTKIPHTAFHNLRHTITSMLNLFSEGKKNAQELLGHADGETTEWLYP